MKPILINGWHFEQEEYYKSWSEGILLTASIETSNICNLACSYCFREEKNVVSKKRLNNELTLEESLKLIDDLAQLGVRCINIAGAGEPLLDPHLPAMLERIFSYNIIPLIATNGSCINDFWINKFKETGASVMIKVNSFDSRKQDLMVNRKNYSKIRDMALNKLISAGFNKLEEGVVTRLSINSLVSRETIYEIPEIFEFCRNNNIMPCMETFIPAGKTRDWSENEVGKMEFLDLARSIKMRDISRNIFYDRLWPYLGGVPCTQNGKSSMFIDIRGDVFDCPAGRRKYGNIRDSSIEEIFGKVKASETNYCFGCPIRDSFGKM
ncbi:MAG: radical SAM protein [Nanoarchaeota archaeon]|jgi:MoaA/NifB/PqqE/SkfB family radical SAM enzyme|nr:radical SAM protein [Nanoarchaeota archaeon]